MSELRTTVVLKDPEQVGFVQRIVRQYKSISEAAVIKLMLRVGFNNLQSMSENELKDALLMG